ncbi:magnesium and cobalt transport protein CorA [Herbaspirillum rhizosphaerae]|uniref:magnesium and cobalt transport protein CorA n=1 Tax=Herbaspirillum rhizosphaerae TaxID=346179 RepID=UPI00067DE569|nr:magnesium and cobalt transport protein CorA [Herbaspirillum rhizosphaerae]
MIETNMIVNCTVYKKGKKLREITLDEISDVLAEDGTFVWLGLLEPNVELMNKIKEEFHLHELAVEDAYAAHQRPKIEEYGDTLFVVLHTAQLADGEVQFGETHILTGPRFVVTVRHGASRSYAKVREHCEMLPERLGRGPSFVLYAIMDFVVDNYRPIMDDLEAKFTQYEAQLFDPTANTGKAYLQELYQLKRQLIRLRSAASPLLDVCTQLLRFHEGLITKEGKVYFRDIYDHVVRFIDTGDRLREMVESAVQINLAQVTIHQNEIVQTLAGWGAILAIPTMIFSLYGMNFANMPGLSWQWSFPLVLLGIATGCSLLWRRLRKAGWL